MVQLSAVCVKVSGRVTVPLDYSINIWVLQHRKYKRTVEDGRFRIRNKKQKEISTIQAAIAAQALYNCVLKRALHSSSKSTENKLNLPSNEKINLIC
jgi:hypothetical protein